MCLITVIKSSQDEVVVSSGVIYTQERINYTAKIKLLYKITNLFVSIVTRTIVETVIQLVVHMLT